MTSVARRDVEDREDIAELMAEFYRPVFANHLLGPIFTVARVDLPAHLPRMGEVWASVLMGGCSHRRNAVRPHLAPADRVELTATQLALRLTLGRAIVDERHARRRAKPVKTQAVRIAGAQRRWVRAASTAQRRTASPLPRPVQGELS